MAREMPQRAKRLVLTARKGQTCVAATEHASVSKAEQGRTAGQQDCLISLVRECKNPYRMGVICMDSRFSGSSSFPQTNQLTKAQRCPTSLWLAVKIQMIKPLPCRQPLCCRLDVFLHNLNSEASGRA